MTKSSDDDDDYAISTYIHYCVDAGALNKVNNLNSNKRMTICLVLYVDGLQ